MLTVQKHFPMWQNHLKANTTGSIFMTKALFLIFSILDLNIYMYVGAHVSRFKYFNINFVFKILFLISVDCIFRASVAAVIFVLNQKQGSFSLPHPLSLPCVQQPHFLPRPSSLGSLQPHGLYPGRRLCPWNSPGKNTGVGSWCLPQGSNLGPALQADSLPHLSHQGSPSLASRSLNIQAAFRSEWYQGQTCFYSYILLLKVSGAVVEGAEALAKATSQRHQDRRTDLPTLIWVCNCLNTSRPYYNNVILGWHRF